MTQSKKIIIGVTGGSGCGKGVFSAAAEKLGFIHIDTDKIAHDIILKPNKAYYMIIEEFGKEVLGENDEIDRKKLGDLVFSDSKKLDKLNDITHPEITKKVFEMLGDMSVIDGAVLYKTPDIVNICDYIVALTNSDERRVDFICKRDGVTPQTALQRIKSQPDNDFYSKNADFVIYSDCGIEEMLNKSSDLIKRCMREKNI